MIDLFYCRRILLAGVARCDLSSTFSDWARKRCRLRYQDFVRESSHATSAAVAATTCVVYRWNMTNATWNGAAADWCFCVVKLQVITSQIGSSTSRGMLLMPGLQRLGGKQTRAAAQRGCARRCVTRVRRWRSWAGGEICENGAGTACLLVNS